MQHVDSLKAVPPLAIFLLKAAETEGEEASEVWKLRAAVSHYQAYCLSF